MGIWLYTFDTPRIRDGGLVEGARGPVGEKLDKNVLLLKEYT